MAKWMINKIGDGLLSLSPAIYCCGLRELVSRLSVTRMLWVGNRLWIDSVLNAAWGLFPFPEWSGSISSSFSSFGTGSSGWSNLIDIFFNLCIFLIFLHHCVLRCFETSEPSTSLAMVIPGNHTNPWLVLPPEIMCYIFEFIYTPSRSGFQFAVIFTQHQRNGHQLSWSTQTQVVFRFCPSGSLALSYKLL